MDFPGVFSDHILPHKIHQINVSFIVDKLEKQFGGTAANIAYNIHLLSPGRALMLACVGQDGQAYLDWMRRLGLSTDAILVEKDLYTASGKVITDRNNNQIWGFYYGALARSNKLKLEKYATQKSLVIISANHYTGFLHFQNSAIKLKIPYLYDPGMILTTISDQDLKKGVEHCRFLVGNDYEIAAIQKRIKLDSQDIIKLGITLITTLGEKGVRYQDEGNDITIPAFAVEETVDLTEWILWR
jgi:adenosine kinase